MVVDTVIDALGVSAFDPAVQVLVLTVGGGVAVKAGALAFWRNTDALVSPTTYLKVGLLLALAAVAVVAGVRRGVLDATVAQQTVYALVLAKLVDQSYMLLSGK